MSKQVGRREMLRRTAIAGAGVWLAGGRGVWADSKSPNEKLNIALVGCGGQGKANRKGVASENIVAFCDVDDRRAAEAFKQLPKVRRFHDFRTMLDKMHKQIDAVVVSTPDHTHTPISVAAMKLGKHVYCEKPLTRTIAEARLMAETAKKYKVATQMGTQGMGAPRSRQGVEVIRSGVLGVVREIHVWTDRALGWWPQGIDRPGNTPPVPEGLHWDLWLGPAPERPYHPAYVPFKWRGWHDFGSGAIGDMGIHNAAMPFMGLRLGLPTSVETVKTSGRNRETYPAWSILRYVFDQPGNLPPLVLHWYDGGKKPSGDLIGGRKVAKNGAIMVGEEGTLYSIEWTGGRWELLPKDKFRDYKPPVETIPRVPDGGEHPHHAEWIAACKGGRPPLCNFVDFAATLTEVMLLGNLSLRTGQKIEWDGKAMRAKNCPGADEFIRYAYRKGWEI
ncbi:MAG: Gfo/Idh/MocA family protein [Planctomycetota bacterium]|jgi:predicted dehydrogenase